MSTTTAGVPKGPGLYAYGTVRKVRDLEVGRKIVYVGQTDNLHRRLDQHSPNKERNAQLKAYLRKERDIMCWYCPLELSKKEIRGLEKEMIESIKPRFNTQHNKPTTEEKE